MATGQNRRVEFSTITSTPIKNTARLIANNLNGTVFSSGAYQLPRKNIFLGGSNSGHPYLDAVYFLNDLTAAISKLTTSIKERPYTYLPINIPIPLISSELRNIPGKTLKDTLRYAPIIGYLSATNIIAASTKEILQLQILINESFNIIQPIPPAGVFTPTQIQEFNEAMGLIINNSQVLEGDDATVLGVFVPGIDYATAWNTIKIPYDASLGIKTAAIAPIPRIGNDQYYRLTGQDPWIGFEGYDAGLENKCAYGTFTFDLLVGTNPTPIYNSFEITFPNIAPITLFGVDGDQIDVALEAALQAENIVYTAKFKENIPGGSLVTFAIQASCIGNTANVSYVRDKDNYSDDYIIN